MVLTYFSSMADGWCAEPEAAGPFNSFFISPLLKMKKKITQKSSCGFYTLLLSTSDLPPHLDVSGPDYSSVADTTFSDSRTASGSGFCSVEQNLVLCCLNLKILHSLVQQWQRVKLPSPKMVWQNGTNPFIHSSSRNANIGCLCLLTGHTVALGQSRAASEHAQPSAVFRRRGSKQSRTKRLPTTFSVAHWQGGRL